MVELVGVDAVRNKTVISIGHVTSSELLKNEINYIECEKSSIDGIVSCILNY